MTVAARGQQTAGGRAITPTEKKPGMDVASQTNTTNFTGAAFNTEDSFGIDAQLNVTAASGTTPSMTVKLQASMDGTNWYDTGSAFAAATGVSSQQQAFSQNLGIFGRWVATITGTTPSFTWNIDTQARRVL